MYRYIYIHFESRPYLHVVQSLASFEPCFRSGAERCKKKRGKKSQGHGGCWAFATHRMQPPGLKFIDWPWQACLRQGARLGFRDCLFPCWPFDTQHALAKHFFLDRRSNRATDGCLGALTDCYCELDKRTLNASAHIRDDPVMNGKKI